MKIEVAGKGIRITLNSGRHLTLEESEARELKTKVDVYYRDLEKKLKQKEG